MIHKITRKTVKRSRNGKTPVLQGDGRTINFYSSGGGGGGGIPDAPIDGSLYGRQDGIWVKAVRSSGDTMTGDLIIKKSSYGYNLTLMPNAPIVDDPDLNRPAVRFLDSDGTTNVFYVGTAPGSATTNEIDSYTRNLSILANEIFLTLSTFKADVRINAEKTLWFRSNGGYDVPVFNTVNTFTIGNKGVTTTPTVRFDTAGDGDLLLDNNGDLHNRGGGITSTLFITIKNPVDNISRLNGYAQDGVAIGWEMGRTSGTSNDLFLVNLIDGANINLITTGAGSVYVNGNEIWDTSNAPGANIPISTGTGSTFLADDGTYKSISTGIPDAPADGYFYGRINNAWAKGSDSFILKNGSDTKAGSLTINLSDSGNNLRIKTANPIADDPNVNRPAIRFLDSDDTSVLYIGTSSGAIGFITIDSYSNNLEVKSNRFYVPITTFTDNAYFNEGKILWFTTTSGYDIPIYSDSNLLVVGKDGDITNTTFSLDTAGNGYLLLDYNGDLDNRGGTFTTKDSVIIESDGYLVLQEFKPTDASYYYSEIEYREGVYRYHTMDSSTTLKENIIKFSMRGPENSLELNDAGQLDFTPTLASTVKIMHTMGLLSDKLGLGIANPTVRLETDGTIKAHGRMIATNNIRSNKNMKAKDFIETIGGTSLVDRIVDLEQQLSDAVQRLDNCGC